VDLSPCVHQHFPYFDLMRLILAAATIPQPYITIPYERRCLLSPLSPVVHAAPTNDATI
jgi:hypothetical protein